MVTITEKIAQMEQALARAREEYERENGRRYEILMRHISPDEKQRILESLTDRHERILFGLEAPPGGSSRPGKSGGELSCPICGKTGLTPRGLALHKVRVHKDQQPEGQQGMFEQEEEGPSSSFARRRHGRGETSAESS